MQLYKKEQSVRKMYNAFQKLWFITNFQSHANVQDRTISEFKQIFGSRRNATSIFPISQIWNRTDQN